MRLLSAVLLSVGYAIIVSALFRLTTTSAMPPWLLALLISCLIFIVIRLSQYEEEIVFLPFAGAGALFSFGSGATIGVGVLMLVFALIGFANAKANSTISDIRALLVWFAASAVCVLATGSVLYLFPTIISVACGLIVYAVSAFLFHLHFKHEKEKKETG